MTVHAGRRPGPQRRTFTFLDDDAERTITVLGERIVPARADPLPWDELGELDAIYLTGGDAGAVRAARAARVLVATPRALGALAESGVTLDVLVGSAHDPGEVYEPGMLPARAARRRAHERRRGRRRGRRARPRPASRRCRGSRDGRGPPRGREPARPVAAWQATPLPGPKVDAYGCGDAFAAALAYGLGAGMTLDARDRARRSLRRRGALRPRPLRRDALDPLASSKSNERIALTTRQPDLPR